MMRSARLLLSLVKFEHTIFALPFAYAGMLLAVAATDEQLTWALVAWITVAMFGARTLAMALNRLIDAEIDARNPRTAQREIPAGKLSRQRVWLLCGVSLALLVAATTQLEPITRWLWPIPVTLFVLYPYTKRFTWMCHFVLGVSIGLAPAAAWLATTGSLETTPVLLSIGIAAWVAGFDMFYATLDVEFDRAQKLFSLPVRFGIARALDVVRVLHAVTFIALCSVGYLAGLGGGFWLAMALVGALLIYENVIVKPDDLSRVNAAFGTTNGVVGVVFVLGVVAGLA